MATRPELLDRQPSRRRRQSAASLLPSVAPPGRAVAAPSHPIPPSALDARGEALPGRAYGQPPNVSRSAMQSGPLSLPRLGPAAAPFVPQPPPGRARIELGGASAIRRVQVARPAAAPDGRGAGSLPSVPGAQPRPERGETGSVSFGPALPSRPPVQAPGAASSLPPIGRQPVALPARGAGRLAPASASARPQSPPAHDLGGGNGVPDRPHEGPAPHARPAAGESSRHRGWQGASALDPGRNPYIRAIREGASGSDPARLSLAMSVERHGETAEDEEAYRISLQAGNESLADVSSCHPTAATLVKTLGHGETESWGSGNQQRKRTRPLGETPEGDDRPPHQVLKATLERIRDGGSPRIMRYTHGEHSLALIAHEGGVEPLEAWAGRGDRARPLHQGVMHPRRPISLGRGIRIASQLGSENNEARERALGRLSRAGFAGFEPPRDPLAEVDDRRLEDVHVGLDRRRIGNPAEVSELVRDRVRATNEALRRAQGEEADEGQE